MSLKNVDKLTKYIGKLLDFQKVDTGRFGTDPKLGDLVGHLREIIGNYIPLTKETDINITFTSQTESYYFVYDREIFERIMNNLLSNAAKYTQPGGNIWVTFHVKGKVCILKVKDNGIGIPARYQRDIFKKYFRAGNAVNMTNQGLGIGLMLVKHLTRLMGGKITFASYENEGTEFVLQLVSANKAKRKKDLNLHESVRENLTVAESTAIQHNMPEIYDEAGERIEGSDRPKILIVDDNPDYLKMIRSILDSDFRVIACSSGLEAIRTAKKYDISVVVSDVMMPEMDGRMLCHELKNSFETCHIPVILLTALTDPDFKIEGYEAGADDYIEKPVNPDILKCRVQGMIATRRKLKEKYLKFGTAPVDNEAGTGSEDNFMEQAVKIIERHIENPEFSVDSFSRELNMSRSLLYRRIKELTDLSPIELITYTRMRSAAEMLRSGRYSIKEVAYKSGFSDPRYFSTLFKKHFYVTPTVYIAGKAAHSGQ
jgi:DNA-binding response OmpR family regulator